MDLQDAVWLNLEPPGNPGWSQDSRFLHMSCKIVLAVTMRGPSHPIGSNSRAMVESTCRFVARSSGFTEGAAKRNSSLTGSQEMPNACTGPSLANSLQVGRSLASAGRPSRRGGLETHFLRAKQPALRSPMSSSHRRAADSSSSQPIIMSSTNVSWRRDLSARGNLRPSSCVSRLSVLIAKYGAQEVP